MQIIAGLIVWIVSALLYGWLATHPFLWYWPAVFLTMCLTILLGAAFIASA
jgi:hypothetical protein